MGRRLAQINLVTGNMSSAVAFYRLVGWDFKVTPDGAHAAAAIAPDLLVELDTADFAAQWNAGAVAEPGGTMLVVPTEDRAGVDALFATVTGAGHRGVQVPYDAFWGARFAVVADPDGHQVGLMSPVSRAAPPASERLRELQPGTTIEAALAFYDALPPAGLDDLVGSWRGEELPTGNPLDGLLVRLGWHGKRFDGTDGAHPLVFDVRGGRQVAVNPAFVPMGVALRHPGLLRRPASVRLFSLLRPLVSTRKPRARLRLMEYRGVVTATMCYDALPINDAFRRVDGDTLLGAMDLRGLDAPFMFVLRRERT